MEGTCAQSPPMHGSGADSGSCLPRWIAIASQEDFPRNMVLNAETFDRPRHTEITIACCVHLGTQHVVIHGEVFALHLLLSVGTAVEVQQPRSYIPSIEVLSKTC